MRVSEDIMTPVLLVGPRRCGKSAAVEEQLAPFRRRIYFGTLWSDPEYHNTLLRHRERRDDRWRLIESSGDVGRDIATLETNLGEILRVGSCGRSPYEENAAVLIDGLTTWARNCARRSGDLLASALAIGEGLAGLMVDSPEVVWRLVDVSTAQLASEERHLDCRAAGAIHRILTAGVESLCFLRY